MQVEPTSDNQFVASITRSIIEATADSKLESYTKQVLEIISSTVQEAGKGKILDLKV